MPSQNYKSASSAYSAASEYGVGADKYRSKRSADDRISGIRRDQMHTGFGAISEAIGIGKNLWDVYEYNKETIDKAESYGLKSTGGWLGNLFGDPEFEDTKTGEKYSSELVNSVSQWDDFYKSKNLMESLIQSNQGDDVQPRSKSSSKDRERRYEDIMGGRY